VDMGGPEAQVGQDLLDDLKMYLKTQHHTLLNLVVLIELHLFPFQAPLAG
jgi:hypothetical protein